MESRIDFSVSRIHSAEMTSRTRCAAIVYHARVIVPGRLARGGADSEIMRARHGDAPEVTACERFENVIKVCDAWRLPTLASPGQALTTPHYRHQYPRIGGSFLNARSFTRLLVGPMNSTI